MTAPSQESSRPFAVGGTRSSALGFRGPGMMLILLAPASGYRGMPPLIVVRRRLGDLERLFGIFV